MEKSKIFSLPWKLKAILKFFGAAITTFNIKPLNVEKKDPFAQVLNVEIPPYQVINSVKTNVIRASTHAKIA